VLTSFKKVLSKTPGVDRLINGLFKRYPDGFYVYLPKESRVTSKRLVGRYVARYVRHPAVAESRIVSYDGKEVIFWYKDDKGVVHFVTMGVEEFIHAVIDHIPDEQFKTIRHYGVYSRGIKRKQESITQSKLCDFPKKIM